MRNSLLGKMIGAHLTVIVIVFLTLFVAVSYLMEYYFHRAKERELVHNAAELAESLARFPDPVGPEVLAVIGTFQQFTGTTVWIVDSAGRIVTPSRDALERAGEVMAALAEETPAAVPAPGDFGLDGFISWRDWDPDTGQPLLSVAVPLRRDDAAGALYVHTPLVGVRSTIRAVRRLLVSAGLMAAGAAAVVGLAFAGRIAAPLHAMNRVVRAMAEGDWRRRVDVRSDDEVGRLGRAFNVMAERLAETIHQLSEEKQKMETILSSMTDGVLFVDETQTVRMANAAAAPVLNVPPADAPGRPLSAVAAHEQLPGLFAQVISHRTAVEATMTGANPEAGRTRTFRVHVAPVTDESGRIRGAVGLFHDDSETVQLQKLRREFIADVSHELRTPLTSVRGFLEAIADGVPRSEEEAGEYLRIAIDETARLQRLADALLEASSIALGGVAFEPVHVPLEPAVRTVVDRVMPQAAARGMTVEVDVPGGLRVWADADKLDRILLNLLDNALHYGRDGGRVTVAARSAGDFVEVSVEDDGPGIPEAEQPLVWERFYKVDKARRKAAGSGLGLVIVRQLVELHGGRVGLHSRPGRGSRFYFTLPVRAEARTGRG